MKTGYRMIHRTSQAVSGSVDTLFMPTKVRAGKSPIILLPGANATNQYSSANGRWASIALAAALASAGIPCATSGLGGNLFSNNTHMTNVSLLRTWIRSLLTAPATKVGVIGSSMGGGAGIRWCGENPTLAAFYMGFIPQVDINDTYVNNRLGLQAQIGAAWGVTFPTALPAGANLNTYAAAMDSNNIPSRIYYAPDDTAIPVAGVLAMINTLGSTCQGFSVGNLGHTEAAMNGAGLLTTPKWGGIIDFAKANGA